MTLRGVLYMLSIVVVFVTVLGSAACNRPSEADCQLALSNIRRILGTENNDFGKSPDVALRACRGNGRKESVACAIRAKTVDDLNACQGPMGKRKQPSDQSEVKPSEKPSQ